MVHSTPLRKSCAEASDLGLSFYIHYGAETVPGGSSSPASDKDTLSNHPKTGTPAPRLRPLIPPRRSSKSLFRYITTNYTDSTSEADLSSPISPSLSVQGSRQRQTGRRIPSERHYPGQGRRRHEDNDALQPLGRELTFTQRSDVWSFETSSWNTIPDEAARKEPDHDQATSEELISDEPISGERIAATAAEYCRLATALQPIIHEPARSSGEQQHPKPSEVVEGLPKADRLVPHPAAQSFEPHLACTGKCQTSVSLLPSGPCSSPSTQPLQASHGQANQISTDADEGPRSPSEHQPASNATESTQPAASMKRLQTQWSHLSRWSDEFDQFPDTLQCSLVEWQAAGADSVSSSRLEQLDHGFEVSTALNTQRPDSFTRGQQHYAETSHTIHAGDGHPMIVIKGAGEEGTSTPNEISLEVEAQPSTSADHVQPQQKFQATTPPNLVPPGARRQLLAPGVAAHSATELLWQMEEHIYQLVFEEQSHREELRIVLGENRLLQQELDAARYMTKERDGEIARLRRLLGEDEGPRALQPSLTPSATRNAGPAQRVGGRSQMKRGAQDSEQQSSCDASDLPCQVNMVPRVMSRAPVYNHGSPEQRVIPRSRPAPPPQRPQLSSGHGGDATENMSEKESSDFYASVWAQESFNEERSADEIDSDTASVVRHEDRHSVVDGESEFDHDVGLQASESNSSPL